MVRPHLVAFLLLLGASPEAPAQEWRRAAEYDVLLMGNDIEPATIRLKAGEPVRLRFVNNSNHRHVVLAGSFFGNAKMRRRDADLAAEGELRVAPGQTRTVALVPRAGRYKIRSGSFLRRLLGMNATIFVE